MGRHGKGVFGVVLLDEGTQLEIFSVEELDSIKRLGIYSNFPAAAREIALAYIVALSRRFELSLRFSFSASPPFPTQTPNPLLFSFVPLVLTQQRVVDPVVWELSVHREVLGWARSAFGG